MCTHHILRCIICHETLREELQPCRAAVAVAVAENLAFVGCPKNPVWGPNEFIRQQPFPCGLCLLADAAAEFEARDAEAARLAAAGADSSDSGDSGREGKVGR